jgi:hypothetical protein
MVLIILAFLLVAGMTFYQAVQGFFSALIMAVLTILCAALAFQYYEMLAAQFSGSQQAVYADAFSLLALFVLPLLALRLLVDRLIRGNALVGALPDRIAGGAVGLVSSMIIVGFFTIIIQLLPTGPRWLTYQPFNDALQREQSLAPFYPDEFTLGLAETLSGGAFKGEKRFGQAHDNLLLEAWCARNQITQVRDVDNEKKTERVGRMDAPSSSLGTLQVFEPNDAPWRAEVPPDPLMLEGEPSKILIVRTQVDESARDTGGKDGEKAVPDAWRLPATQFRLACRKDKSAESPLVNHYPVAYLTAFESASESWTGKITVGAAVQWKPFPAAIESFGDRKLALVGKLAVERPWKDGPKALTIDWVYRIGRDEVPEYVAFRRVARQGVTAVKPGMPSSEKALDRLTKN